MKRVGASAAIALLAAAAIAAPVASHQTMRMGVATTRTDAYDEDVQHCVSRGAMWVQEMGASGINRLRFRFDLHNFYDPTETTWTSQLSTGWLYGPAFPDDARSFYTTFRYSLGFWMGTAYKGRAIGLGERPSFWATDRKIGLNVGDVLCDAVPGGL